MLDGQVYLPPEMFGLMGEGDRHTKAQPQKISKSSAHNLHEYREGVKGGYPQGTGMHHLFKKQRAGRRKRAQSLASPLSNE